MTLYKDTALPHLIDPESRFAPIMIPVIQDMGFRLIRVAFGGSDPKRGAILQVMIEPMDGSKLQIDACKPVSQALSAIMDVEDAIKDSYVLEVGSCGLDRPLTDQHDFKRFEGFEAKLEARKADETGQRKFRGFLAGTDENGVTLKTAERGHVVFGWDDLAMARLVASDNLLKALQKGEV